MQFPNRTVLPKSPLFKEGTYQHFLMVLPFFKEGLYQVAVIKVILA